MQNNGENLMKLFGTKDPLSKLLDNLEQDKESNTLVKTILVGIFDLMGYLLLLGILIIILPMLLPAFILVLLQKPALFVIDSIGEFDTLTIWNADEEKGLQRIYSQQYPHSIGLWYSAFTQRIGLKPQEDEYILMGMAAYGDPLRFFNEILQEFFYPIDSHDGIRGWIHMFRDTPSVKLRHNLHRGCMWWRPELNKPQDLFDIAAAVQAIYAYLLKYISNWARWKSPSGNLILMGGCALNCAANGTIKKDWNDMYIMPNPGDAGSVHRCSVST